MMNERTKNAAKFVIRNTLGRLPASPSRFNDKLAIDGGTPVRNQRLRPWKKQYNNSSSAWSGASQLLRDIFLRGVEGLPQPRAKEFAEKWAKVCGCKYG